MNRMSPGKVRGTGEALDEGTHLLAAPALLAQAFVEALRGFMEGFLERVIHGVPVPLGQPGGDE
ncbi:MAG TPA: hypothetical protein VEY88_18665, partial [Archangium sp.]|nr:hypothetical protein [Archangium sp.]